MLLSRSSFGQACEGNQVLSRIEDNGEGLLLFHLEVTIICEIQLCVSFTTEIVFSPRSIPITLINFELCIFCKSYFFLVKTIYKSQLIVSISKCPFVECTDEIVVFLYRSFFCQTIDGDFTCRRIEGNCDILSLFSNELDVAVRIALAVFTFRNFFISSTEVAESPCLCPSTISDLELICTSSKCTESMFVKIIGFCKLKTIFFPVETSQVLSTCDVVFGFRSCECTNETNTFLYIVCNGYITSLCESECNSAIVTCCYISWSWIYKISKTMPSATNNDFQFV